MDIESISTTGKEDLKELLPVRFRPDPAAQPGKDAHRGAMPGKRAKDYYLGGLTSVFHPEVSLPGALVVAETFAGAEVALLYPGPTAVEVLDILKHYPAIKCLHIIESAETTIDAIRSELQKVTSERNLPETAGYITDLRHLPAELAGRCDLVVEINVVDPKADRLVRQDIAVQISRALKTGGLFYSAGKTVRWSDSVNPLSLVRIPVEPEILKRAGYSDALPQPVFHQKHPPDAPMALAEEENLREWWNKGLSLIGQGTETMNDVPVEAPFVPRVEDGRGEPNTAPWNFLITKPAVRRPAMTWTPKEGDPFGNLTLGALLQYNSQTGMYVFRIREHPKVVLKTMKPFEGDIPDDPLTWDSLRKSKTLKRENQALKLLKGLTFIPQRIAYGYDPLTGWYAIVVEFEPGQSLSNYLYQQYNKLRRNHETNDDVERALEPVLMLLNSLEVIHRKGLVHQDLKPAHVLLRPDSREAVLIDWGLARKIDEPLSDDRRSISWLHAAPERVDMNIQTTAAIHQDLYAVGVMLLQLASDLNLNDQPRFLLACFIQHGHMPSAAELELKLRPHWQWAAPVIGRAIRSRKEVPGYANHRYTSAGEMAEEIIRRHGKPPAPSGSEKEQKA